MVDNLKYNKVSKKSSFISIIFVVNNKSKNLKDILEKITDIISNTKNSYEIIVIDNGSTDYINEIIEDIVSPTGLPNIQIYTLVEKLDNNTALWVGIENSIGDFMICLNPFYEDMLHLKEVLKESEDCYDLIFTRYKNKASKFVNLESFSYRLLNKFTKLITRKDIGKYSSEFVGLSRKVVNYIIKYPEPHLKFRQISSSRGFKKKSLIFNSKIPNQSGYRINESFVRGIKLITSSSKSPLRLVTIISSLTCFFNLIYSAYVILIYIFYKDVQSGWASLSLQNSFSFLLISLVLLVMSEYILEISRKINAGPSYFISKENTSSSITRKEKLNITKSVNYPIKD